MTNLEIEYESFAAAFLDRTVATATYGGGPTPVYEPALYSFADPTFDYEVMAEVPEALNAFIEHQHEFDL